MLIEVIPFDISLDNFGLTYFVKNELKKQINIGSIVSIPIRNNIKYGIVSKIGINGDDSNIKSIIEVICSEPILADYEIQTIYDLSKKYFVHLHKVLNLFLPKFIFNTLEKKSFEDMTKEELRIESGKLRVENKNSLLIYNYSNKDIGLIIEDILEKHKDCVFIFPDDFSLNYFIEQNEKLADKSIIYRNAYTYNKKYKTFLDVFYKTKNIIIGTRKILQYNLKKYKTIIYIEDVFVKYNFSYTHKYKNIEIFDSIIKNGNFFGIIVSTIPSIESIYKTYSKKYKLINF